LQAGPYKLKTWFFATDKVHESSSGTIKHVPTGKCAQRSQKRKHKCKDEKKILFLFIFLAFANYNVVVITSIKPDNTNVFC